MERNAAARMLTDVNGDVHEGGFFWSGGPVEVAERTWFQSLGSGVTAFETDEGIVLVDACTEFFGEQVAGWLRQRTQAPIHTVVYTHGHIDHAFGLRYFLAEGQDPPRIIGQRRMAERFRRYAATPHHNHTINTRQFGGTADDREMDSPDAVAGFGYPSHTPTEYYDDELTFSVGGLGFELRACRGETDDHTWVWCPDRGVLCPGDLVINAVPNAGNPQKAQRYPWDWAAGLRQMAALEPMSIAPGHGGPVVDDLDEALRLLNGAADLLESIVAQTLAALEDGSPPHVDIVHAVELPESYPSRLEPMYDDPEFIIRNTIRYYGGWWTGRPSELKPAPRTAVAAEIAALAGGAAVLVERAAALAAGGDDRLACHLADYALEAAPDDADVQEAVARIYEDRSLTEPGLMSTNLFLSAAAYARAGRPFA